MTVSRERRGLEPGSKLRFMRAERGDAAVEYLFLVGTIALPAIAAFVTVGKSIVSAYVTMQNVLALPLP